MWLEGNNKPRQFSNSFFEGIVNLKVLVLKGMQVFPSQVSVQTFDKLIVLNLDGCDLNETSMSIVPENIETLRLFECRIQDPLDFSRLKYLKKLEVVNDGQIELMPNAISTLPSTLEVLHIPGGFRIFDAEGERSVPISSVLNKLTSMTSLNIWLEDSRSCPAEYIVANRLDFIIYVSDKLSYRPRSRHSDMRSVVFHNRCIDGGGEVLVERAEVVILRDVKGSQHGFKTSTREAFSTLKKLTIESCEDMEHLVGMPQYEIQQSQSLISFSNLTSLAIDECSGLKYLFSASVAEYLLQLQELHVRNCPTLEVVIRKESVIDGVVIRFQKLKRLTLKTLQSLKRFYHGVNKGTSSSSTTIMEDAAESDSIFDGMVEFPALERLTIQDVYTSKIWDKSCCHNNSFCQLKLLRIWRCPYLEYAVPVAMFQNLEDLDIRLCESMISEVESSDSSNESSNAAELPILGALRSIFLSQLPALTQTRLNSGGRYLYPNLESLFLFGCSSLRNVLVPSIAKHLQHLQKLEVKHCEMMSEIIGEGERKEEKIDEFVFAELTTLELNSLPKLKNFCFTEETADQHPPYSALKLSFPKLEKLHFRETTIKLEEIVLGINDFTFEIKELEVVSGNELQLPHKWQVQLPNIEHLDLENCWWNGSSREDNVGQFLFNPRGTLSFQRLKIIKVQRCGLSALFSCSIFMNLCQLQELEVKNCPLLEEVVREDKILGTNNGIISLLQLESIRLEHLPKLKSFSGSRNYAFNMQALEYVTVRDCPQIEYFTCLEINSPLIRDLNNKTTEQPKGSEFIVNSL